MDFEGIRRWIWRAIIVSLLPFAMFVDALSFSLPEWMAPALNQAIAVFVSACLYGTILEAFMSRAFWKPTESGIAVDSSQLNTTVHLVFESSIELNMTLSSACRTLLVCILAIVAAFGVICLHLSHFIMAHPIIVSFSIMLSAFAAV